jgi:hypothetical protein
MTLRVTLDTRTSTAKASQGGAAPGESPPDQVRLCSLSWPGCGFIPHEGLGGWCDTGSAANGRIRTRGRWSVRHRLSDELSDPHEWWVGGAAPAQQRAVRGGLRAGWDSSDRDGAAGRLPRAEVYSREASTQERVFAVTSGIVVMGVTVGEACGPGRRPESPPAGTAGAVVTAWAVVADLGPRIGRERNSRRRKPAGRCPSYVLVSACPARPMGTCHPPLQSHPPHRYGPDLSSAC